MTVQLSYAVFTLSICFCINIVFLDEDNNLTYDYFLCRQCGHEVASAQHITRIASSAAKHQRNDTILGEKEVLIQLFENPHGNQFEIVTASEADIYKHDEAVSEYSWFPGFSWRVCLCPKCGVHLGWFFEPNGYSKEDAQNTFIGLILQNLLHNTYADNLLITPKSYYS